MGDALMHGAARAFARLFLVQAAHNYDRMTGLGVAWAAEPMLAELPDASRAAARRRGTQVFNSHPYLAGMAVGAIARAEYDGVPGTQIERLRSALAGPLGAVGDKLVWAGTLPATVAAGIVIAVLAGPVAGIVAFLVLHNLLHLVLRWWGLRAGQHLGLGIAAALNAPLIRTGLRIAGPLAGFAIGVMLPIAARAELDAVPAAGRASVLVVALVALLVGRWLTPTVGALRMGLALVAAALAIGWIWPR